MRYMDDGRVVKQSLMIRLFARNACTIIITFLRGGKKLHEDV